MKKLKIRNDKSIILTIEEIREIVRMEINAEKEANKQSEKQVEKVWTDLRRSDRIPAGWLSKPVERKPTLEEDKRNQEESENRDSALKHISNGENPILDEAVIYELKAQIVSYVISELRNDLTRSLRNNFDFICKRYQEAGSKDGISSIILLPLPQDHE